MKDAAYKAAAKAIKAAGLQKLRFYCQMCEKQCRDENGFKCHTTSASHLRQMAIFAEDPEKYMDMFSDRFLEGFMEVFSRRFRNQDVHVNVVYQEFIRDRGHIHMNSTKWTTLSNFAQWLGREGLAEVRETPKGFFIRYIDRDPELLARQKAAEKKEAMDKTDEEINEELIARQIAAAAALNVKETVATELKRDAGVTVKFGLKPTAGGDENGEGDDEKPTTTTTTTTTSTTSSTDATSNESTATNGGGDEPAAPAAASKQNGQSGSGSVGSEERNGSKDKGKSEESKNKAKGSSAGTTAVKLGGIGRLKKKPKTAVKASGPKLGTNVFESVAVSGDNGGGGGGGGGSKPKRKRSKLDDVIAEEQAKREKTGRTDYWLNEGIVVKVVDKSVGGGAYYKQKGVIGRVVDNYVAEVTMLKSGDTLRIDQDDLQTVLPSIGQRVKILNGGYRDEIATLDAVNVEKFTATVTVAKGLLRGRTLTDVDYEDISKLAPSS